jgi:hypothetical protein
MKAIAPLLAVAAAAAFGSATAAGDHAPLPQRLADTGLYLPGTQTVRPEHFSFAPQYPLWSDGSVKRRWISLPTGAPIDASQPDAWEFPVGTRLWKEFSMGRRVETRYLERLADGSWRFATYVWNEAGTEARLAPEAGATIALTGAPNGKYVVPSRGDCVACHDGAPVPVLGFSALQLSPDRDPLAPHAEPARASDVDLRKLVAGGHLRRLPQRLLDRAPGVAARSAVERAALGYLHGNCGHCHNAAGALTGLELVLAQEVNDPRASAERTVASLLGHSSRFRPHGAMKAERIAANGDGSVLTLRMRSTNRFTQMPPLGVAVPDQQGIALVERWIREQLTQPKEMP